MKRGLLGARWRTPPDVHLPFTPSSCTRMLVFSAHQHTCPLSASAHVPSQRISTRALSAHQHTCPYSFIGTQLLGTCHSNHRYTPRNSSPTPLAAFHHIQLLPSSLLALANCRSSVLRASLVLSVALPPGASLRPFPVCRRRPRSPLHPLVSCRQPNTVTWVRQYNG